MTNIETIKEIINVVGKESVMNAIRWFAGEAGATDKAAAYDVFLRKVSDFDNMIQYKTLSSYLINNKSDVVESAKVLFNTGAIAGYIQEVLA